MKINALILSTLAILGLGLTSSLHAHGHINAGVIWNYDSSTNTWSSTNKLGFKNANEFAYDFVTNSGYILDLPKTNIGGIAAHYGGTAFHSAWTPTALRGNSGRRFSTLGAGNVPNYLAWEDYNPSSNGVGPVAGAQSGSYLRMTLTSIERLSGSATSFSIWQNNQTSILGEWIFAGNGFGTLKSGGNNTFNLTANNSRIGPGNSTPFPDTSLPLTSTYPSGWSAAAIAAGFRWNVPNTNDLTTAVDPFGHIHGRNFATNAPGNFRLIWQISDANGIHTDSDLFTMRFSAIPEPTTAAFLTLAGACLYFRCRRRQKKC